MCACPFSHPLEKDEILADVASRLWFTYRKNFPAIGECRLLQESFEREA